MTQRTDSRCRSGTAPRWLATAAAALLFSACGGGGGAGTPTAAGAATGAAAAAPSGTSSLLGSLNTSGEAAAPRNDGDRQATRYAASRFLTWSTFGPTEADIEQLIKNRDGYTAWFTRQFALPATSHRAHWEAAHAALQQATPPLAAGQDQVWESFWRQSVTGPDQLRQRMAFALSQIFVISALDGNVGNEPRAMAAWLDMLGDKGFTTYRELLESVTLHPLMGFYLSHLRNQKANPTTGRIPDQNYAREVMQLFSIGLVKLNPDGTPVIEGGRTVETYTPEDVAGLSRVFTGFSFACPAAPNNNCFNSGSSGGVSDPDRMFKSMIGYPQYHSTEAKTFLGVTIPVQATANPAASLKTALDTLANHPNVAPFFSRQLIQRLVTSNPSPAYVQAVAAVFDDNGAGVRGDLKAVLRAVLTHPQAFATTAATGKVREPVLRLSAYLRAYPHTSDSGAWKVGNTDNAASSLGQTPLRAPSVFNFFRPGYVSPGGQTAAAGLVAPELQALNETSVAGWVNFMRDNLTSGVGQRPGTAPRRDIQRDWAPDMALSMQPVDLVNQVSDRLTYGSATPALKNEIVAAVTSIAVPALNAGGTNQAAIDSAQKSRVYTALLLTLASPEFLNQK